MYMCICVCMYVYIYIYIYIHIVYLCIIYRCPSLASSSAARPSPRADGRLATATLRLCACVFACDH